MENIIIFPFNVQVEPILNLISVGKDDIRQMLAANHILNYKLFKLLDKKHLLNMTHNVHSMSIKLLSYRVSRIVEFIKFIRFHEANGDNNLAANPTCWDENDFKV